MGLGELEKPKELWSVVVSKEGKEYPNMHKCNSIKQLEEEEPELSNAINNAFQKWYKETGEEAAEKALTTYGKDGGYSYKHSADGNTYKLSKYNGQLQLTRIKGSGSWGKKSTYTYTFMRTEVVRVGPIDTVNQTLQSQGATDSWKITKVAGESMKDMIFLMELQKQYTPTGTAAATTDKKDADKKEEDSEE